MATGDTKLVEFKSNVIYSDDGTTKTIDSGDTYFTAMEEFGTTPGGQKILIPKTSTDIGSITIPGGINVNLDLADDETMIGVTPDGGTIRVMATSNVGVADNGTQRFVLASNDESNDYLAGYLIVESDEAGTTKYYAFQRRNGSYYIMKVDTVANTTRYYKGTLLTIADLAAKWAVRASAVTYDYPSNVF